MKNSLKYLIKLLLIVAMPIIATYICVDYYLMKESVSIQTTILLSLVVVGCYIQALGIYSISKHKILPKLEAKFYWSIGLIFMIDDDDLMIVIGPLAIRMTPQIKFDFKPII